MDTKSSETSAAQAQHQTPTFHFISESSTQSSNALTLTEGTLVFQVEDLSIKEYDTVPEVVEKLLKRGVVTLCDDMLHEEQKELLVREISKEQDVAVSNPLTQMLGSLNILPYYSVCVPLFKCSPERKLLIEEGETTDSATLHSQDWGSTYSLRFLFDKARGKLTVVQCIQSLCPSFSPKTERWGGPGGEVCTPGDWRATIACSEQKFRSILEELKRII